MGDKEDFMESHGLSESSSSHDVFQAIQESRNDAKEQAGNNMGEPESIDNLPQPSLSDGVPSGEDNSSSLEGLWKPPWETTQSYREATATAEIEDQGFTTEETINVVITALSNPFGAFQANVEMARLLQEGENATDETALVGEFLEDNLLGAFNEVQVGVTPWSGVPATIFSGIQGQEPYSKSLVSPTANLYLETGNALGDLGIWWRTVVDPDFCEKFPDHPSCQNKDNGGGGGIPPFIINLISGGGGQQTQEQDLSWLWWMAGLIVAGVVVYKGGKWVYKKTGKAVKKTTKKIKKATIDVGGKAGGKFLGWADHILHGELVTVGDDVVRRLHSKGTQSMEAGKSNPKIPDVIVQKVDKSTDGKFEVIRENFMVLKNCFDYEGKKVV